MEDKKSVVEEAKELLAKVTPEPLVFVRYEHGGGRLYRDNENSGRTLVADFYGEGDREFYRDAPSLVDELIRANERLGSALVECEGALATAHRALLNEHPAGGVYAPALQKIRTTQKTVNAALSDHQETQEQ